MSYFDVAQMAQNFDLQARVTACAAQEGVAGPNQWALEHMLAIASEAGWAEAWATAEAAGNEQPGRDPDVISDAMVLAAVQANVT